MRHSSILALALGFSSIIRAQPASNTEQNERSAYQTALVKMKVEQPEQYEKSRRLATVLAEMMLGRLGYGVGSFDGVLSDNDKAALLRYQAQRGLALTGDPLDFDTTKRLGADLNLLDSIPLPLPRRIVSLNAWNSGWVSAEGTWTIVGDKMASPERTATIQCERGRAICTEAQAIVGNGLGGRYLENVDLNVHEIERWDDKEITTKPLEFGCVRYVLRINRSQQSVTAIRSTTSTEGICKDVTNSEFYLVLSDGGAVYDGLQRTYQETLQLMQITPEMSKLITGR
jgi:peptidoglycan hydrolase-like protein with peptidoglycan-binding domain